MRQPRQEKPEVKSAAAKHPAKAKPPSAKTTAAKPAVSHAGVKASGKSVLTTKAKTLASPKTPAAKAAATKQPAPKAPVAKGAASKAKAPIAKPVAPKAPAAKGAASKAPVKAPAKTPASKSHAAKPAAVSRPAAPKLLPLPVAASRPVPVAVRKDPRLANNWKIKPIEQWTDPEVIAMPDGEYMNDKQLAFFRLKLVELKDGILSNAGQTAENLRDDTVVVPDPADRATIEEEHALELRTRDRERKLLKKIEQSIARIDAGDYGYCDETGEPIGVPRLLARPTATLSLEAQQRREMKQKMFGD